MEKATLEAEADTLNDLMAGNEGTDEAEEAMDRLTQVCRALQSIIR